MDPFLLTDDGMSQFVGQYIWPFMRIGAFFMAVPIIGAKMIPARVRLALAMSLTMLVSPLLANIPTVQFMSIEGMLMVVSQIIIGIAMGFVMQVAMQVFTLAGQFIAMKMGLGFASMNDPASGVSVTIISQYYLIVSTLLFVSVNGHLLLIDYIVDSFTYIPISSAALPASTLWFIASMGGWMFSSALVIALPLLTALLVVNLAFGVMSRAAPQMNVFAVGFPITLVFGMMLMWVGMTSFLPNFYQFIEQGFAAVKTVMGAP